jgi:glycosyltransferase involved in cell wall biosynthesis
MNHSYLLSVRLMVFNHESYIREAMEGILKQKTTFPIEVVVGDDFSNDNSLAIIKEYQSTENIHFKILERKIGDNYWQNRQKLGRLHNFYNIIENCTGKYIALLDGDDFWTDPLKLQKQVDFLEANTDFSICFHNMKIVNESNPSTLEFTNSINQESVFSILDLASKGNFMFTASVVFKKPKDGFPNWLTNLPIGDYAMHLFNAQFGKIKFLDELMGVYRIHETGIWGSFSKEKLYDRWIPMLEQLQYKFSDEVNKTLRAQKIYSLLDVYMISYKKKDSIKANEAMALMMEVNPFFMAMKLTEVQNRLDKTLNSNAYKIGKMLVTIFAAPIQIFKNKK